MPSEATAAVNLNVVPKKRKEKEEKKKDEQHNKSIRCR
jgi:hypothetical protein